MSELVIWAQALDNESPDHIYVQGRELTEDYAEERQNAVSKVSKVTRRGVRVFESSGVRLTADRLNFVIELPSVQRDVVGRIAPIICYGDCDRNTDAEFGARIYGRMREFAAAIGRDLHSEHLGVIRDAFAVLKKKTALRTMTNWIASAALMLALVLAAYWQHSTK